MSKILDIIGSDSYHKQLLNLGATEKKANRFQANLSSYLKANPSLLNHAESVLADFFNKVSGLVVYDLSFGDEVYLSSYQNKKGNVYLSKNIMIGGLMKMIQRVPGLQVYRPIIVSEHDHFDYKVVMENGNYAHTMEYTPSFSSDGITKDNLKCGFIAWEVTTDDGEVLKDSAIISKSSILASRALSAKQRGGEAPVWDNNFEAMCQKTMVRRVAKYLPLDAREMINDSSDGDEIDREKVEQEPVAKYSAEKEATEQPAEAKEQEVKRKAGRPPKPKAESAPPPTEQPAAESQGEEEDDF